MIRFVIVVLVAAALGGSLVACGSKAAPPQQPVATTDPAKDPAKDPAADPAKDPVNDPTKDPAKPAENPNRALKQMSEVACACKDAVCAKASVETFVTWVNAHKDAQGDENQAEADTKQLLECSQKAGLSQDDLAKILKKLTL